MTLQVLRLPRKNEPEVLQVLRLPRKTSRRYSKCCACHAKRRPKSSLVAGLPRTSMKMLQVLRLPRKKRKSGAPSAAPATEKTPEVLQVGKGPDQECCACHAKRDGAQSHHSSPDFRRPLYEGAPKELRLPRKTRRRPKSSLVADLYEGAPSAAPATEYEPDEVLQVLRLPRKTGWHPKSSLVAGLPRTYMKMLQVSSSAAPATQNKPEVLHAAPTTQNEPEVLQVLRLLATQNEAAPKVITCRRTSADLFEGASAAPATQQKELEVLQVLPLPRNTSLMRCSKCCACHAKRGGTQSHHSSPDFRGLI